MIIHEIILPWMPTKLCSNTRAHWAIKGTLTKQYRKKAFDATIKAGIIAPQHNNDVEIVIIFNPPNNKSDKTNFAAHGGLKAYIDGIADAMNINDKRFTPAYFYGDKVKGGSIIIQILL